MKKILFTLLLMITAASILCTFMGCREEDTDLPPSLDTTDSTLPDTTDDTPSDTTAKTTETPDTEPQQPEDKIWEDLGMTEQEWNDFATEHADYFPEYIHETVMAMLTGDIDTFAKNLGAPAEVYEYVKDMKFGNYRMYTAEVPAKDDPSQTRRYPTLEIEILESTNDFFKIGTNRLVFILGGIAPYIEHIEDIEWYADNANYPEEQITSAQEYIEDVLTFFPRSKHFEDLLSKEKLCAPASDTFILSRLYKNSDGSRMGFTKDEIYSYAEKYLAIDSDSVEIDERFYYEETEEYYIPPRGGTTVYLEYESEETHDGITVLTVRFYADYSKTVQSRLVEFHLKQIDNEYSPVKIVIVQDSNHVTARFAV